jgi:hypothetical protein
MWQFQGPVTVPIPGLGAHMPGNPFMPGASGGPWIGDFSSGMPFDPTKNFVCGLNSQLYVKGAPEAKSPEFDDNLWDLYQNGPLWMVTHQVTQHGG